MAATSAGFMNIPQQTDTVKAVEMGSKQISIQAFSTLTDLKNVTFQRRPIEPGVLFLFGMGIIGIIGIHRIKFQ
jgi:hypothetical protein